MIVGSCQSLGLRFHAMLMAAGFRGVIWTVLTDFYSNTFEGS